MTCSMIIINASGLLLGSTSSTLITLFPSDSQFLQTFFFLYESELYIKKPKIKENFDDYYYQWCYRNFIHYYGGGSCIIEYIFCTMVVRRGFNYYFNYAIIDLWPLIEFIYFFLSKTILIQVSTCVGFNFETSV